MSEHGFYAVSTDLLKQAEQLAKKVLETNEQLDIDRFAPGIVDLAVAVKKGTYEAPFVSSKTSPLEVISDADAAAMGLPNPYHSGERGYNAYEAAKPGPIETLKAEHVIRLECFTCNGRGMILDDVAPGQLPVGYKCPACSGNRLVAVKLCEPCKGTGQECSFGIWHYCETCDGRGLVRI